MGIHHIQVHNLRSQGLDPDPEGQLQRRGLPQRARDPGRAAAGSGGAAAERAAGTH